MNATELFHKDGRPAGVFYCGQCRLMHREQAAAERCCAPYKCERCGCDVPRERHLTICQPCKDLKDAEHEAARFAAAEKVTEWDGWIFVEDITGYNDHYFASVAELMDYIADDTPGEEELATLSEEERAEIPKLPAYVWTCDEDHFVNASKDDIVDRISDNAYEDFDCADLNGLEALEAALVAFNEANSSFVSYSPNYKRALVLSGRESG